jgi:hypothetical protein
MVFCWLLFNVGQACRLRNIVAVISYRILTVLVPLYLDYLRHCREPFRHWGCGVSAHRLIFGNETKYLAIKIWTCNEGCAQQFDNRFYDLIQPNVSVVIFDSYLLAAKRTEMYHQFDTSALVAVGFAYVFGMSDVWGVVSNSTGSDVCEFNRP